MYCANCIQPCKKALVCQDCRLQIYCGEKCRRDHLEDHVSLCNEKIWKPEHVAELKDVFPKHHKAQADIASFLAEGDQVDLKRVQKHVATLLSTPEHLAPVGGALFRARLWVMRKFKRGRDDILLNVTAPKGAWSTDREKLEDVIAMVERLKERLSRTYKKNPDKYKRIKRHAEDSLKLLDAEEKGSNNDLE